MTDQLLDRYRTASEWTLSKVMRAGDQLDAPTPCDDWDVRTLLNHMLETQQYFLDRARGEQAPPLSPEPPDGLIGNDATAAYERGRTAMIATFSDDRVVERTGPSLGIAFSDTLLHGWDVARATGQDTTMPVGLAQAAYGVMHGAFPDDQRKGVFGPELPVGDDASPQEKLLAYTGRDPS
ncbi:MAG TPA: TIGR03086 family metal-binding protein [Acidimicrobiia bacterium]